MDELIKILKQDRFWSINKNYDFYIFLKQIIKFSMIGLLNTTVDLLILNTMSVLCCITDGIGFVIIKSISFMAAVTCSYFANKQWTFNDRSSQNNRRKFSQFLSVSLLGMLINVSVATIVVSSLKIPINHFLQLTILSDGIWINIGALTGTAVGLMWNFIGYKFLVFGKA